MEKEAGRKKFLQKKSRCQGYRPDNLEVKRCGFGYGELLEHSIEMILHSQWNKPIELRFTGVRKCNIVGWQDNYFCEILGVYMSFHTDLLGKTCDDKLIVWADWDCFNPINYTEEKLISPNGKNCTYVIAEKLFWRIMTEN